MVHIVKKTFVGFWVGLYACSCFAQAPATRFHAPDYDCIAPDIFGQAALTVYLTDKAVAEADTTVVTPQEEIQSALPLIRKLSKEGLLIAEPQNVYPEQWHILQQSLKKFLNLPFAKRFPSYSLHLIQSGEINAFTAGSHIFFTEGLLQAAGTDKDVLSFILFHEIGHNELKHIYINLKRKKALGEPLAALGSLVFLSLNQFNELEADCYALDVMHMLAMDMHKGIEFFAVLEKSQAENNSRDHYFLDKLFSTHPLNGERLDCLKEYLRNHF